MFSALKKLTRGGEERSSGAPTRMPSSLQKKFSRGVHYNMKILIKGDRNVGKSCLLQRLQGGPFIEEYVPTEQIQAAAINWTYKDTDHIVKVEVWEVVDKARSKRKPPLGLKLDNAAAAVDDDTPALDATFLDVYKDASGVILIMDITKPWTFDYVVKELSNVPADLPLVLLGNHCDMQHHRQVHAHHIEEALHHAAQTRTAPVRYAESSMRNGFGLRLLHKFLSVPFLRLQRSSLLQQLQRNQKEMQDVEQQLTDYQNSEESDYVVFVERLASKRRGAGGEAPRGERSPSIVLGAGKPILPPNVNLIMSSKMAAQTTEETTVPRNSDPQPPQQTEYVSAELLARTQRVALDSANNSVSRGSTTSGAASGGVAGGGELDEFYAGTLDSSFLDDAATSSAQFHQTSYESDSDNDNKTNPMVASAQDDLDDLDFRANVSGFTNLVRSENATSDVNPYKLPARSEHVELVAPASVAEGGQGDAGSADSQYREWIHAARRSPEGGEDPDNSTERPSLKEEKKHKKAKKSKDKDGDSERSERKKHKHKKNKSEKKQQGLLLTPEQETHSQQQYDSL